MKHVFIRSFLIVVGLTVLNAQAQQTSNEPSALTYFNTAHELAAQGEIAYPVPFVDLSLWNDAVNNAAAAVDLEPDNLDYLRYLGQLYTTTQWWSEGYKVWKTYESKKALDAEAAGWAAKTCCQNGLFAFATWIEARGYSLFNEFFAMERRCSGTCLACSCTKQITSLDVFRRAKKSH